MAKVSQVHIINCYFFSTFIGKQQQLAWDHSIKSWLFYLVRRLCLNVTPEVFRQWMKYNNQLTEGIDDHITITFSNWREEAAECNHVALFIMTETISSVRRCSFVQYINYGDKKWVKKMYQYVVNFACSVLTGESSRDSSNAKHLFQILGVWPIATHKRGLCIFHGFDQRHKEAI